MQVEIRINMDNNSGNNSKNISLYDKEINELKEYLSSESCKCIKQLETDKHWEVTDRESLVLRSDMAYELGGGTNEAVSSIAFTTSDMCVDKDGVFLLGDDLPDISEDTSYARLTFIRLDKNVVDTGNTQALYGIFRAIDYVRYHTFPKGYMMRISSVREREPVRVSKEALSDGMTLAHIGSELINAYKKRKEVAAVQIYFITEKEADYAYLRSKAHRLEQITGSLNHIFNGLVMDCSTCKSRELCDEIDGMKELHMESVKENGINIV